VGLAAGRGRVTNRFVTSAAKGGGEHDGGDGDGGPESPQEGKKNNINITGMGSRFWALLPQTLSPSPTPSKACSLNPKP
jgi:hypothetical protein